jgi:hypothetical protein
MPLPTAAPRKALHTRTITCDGYAREDGLWDIEARMEDIKHYTFDNKFRGKVDPGEPLHEMYMRLTLNDDLEVMDVAADIDHFPFLGCPKIAVDYRKLIGVKIGVGWRRAINERLGGKQGCTHLTELLPVLATVAIQTMMPEIIRRRREEAEAAGDGAPKMRPPMLDSCHSWASDSPTVKEFAPDYYTGD